MRNELELQNWSARARVCLQRLKDAPELQIAYLQDLGVAELADELALEFDDALRPLAALLEELPQAQVLLSLLRQIDSALSKQDLGWTFDALRPSPDWDEVRKLASFALQANWWAW